MAIGNNNVVDIAGIDKATGRLVLTISDHLPWGGPEEKQIAHMDLLQEKINAYLRFIEGGEARAHYPHADPSDITIQIMAAEPPSSLGQEFLDEAEQVLARAGYKLQYTIVEPSEHCLPVEPSALRRIRASHRREGTPRRQRRRNGRRQ